MNRIKFVLMATVVAASTLFCVSCDKDEEIMDPEPIELPLISITLSLDIDKGSLPEEYVSELSTVTVRRYADESGFPDIATLVDKCVAVPMQEKVDEIAETTGCYDFSVTISAYDIKDTTKIVYTKTIKPTK